MPAAPENLDSFAIAGNPNLAARRRGRPAELNLRQILDVAKRLLGPNGDPSELNLRALASELGVTAMALYRYVADKDDLLQHLVDESVEALGLPDDPAGTDWKPWMRDVAIRLFDLIVASPVAAYIFSTRPVKTPAALCRMEASLRVLTNAGMTNNQALDVYSQIHTYTLGFGSVAASRIRHASASPRQLSWQEFFQNLPIDTYPHLVQLAPDLADMTSRQRFVSGLDFLLGLGDFAGLTVATN